MRYLFVGDSAHAALESSALLGKFDTFALPLFDDAAFELVKRTDERQHKFREATDRKKGKRGFRFWCNSYVPPFT